MKRIVGIIVALLASGIASAEDSENTRVNDVFFPVTMLVNADWMGNIVETQTYVNPKHVIKAEEGVVATQPQLTKCVLSISGRNDIDILNTCDVVISGLTL